MCCMPTVLTSSTAYWWATLWIIFTLQSHTHSNGIGRTGAFITLHAQLERLKIEGVVDVFQFIKSARRQREGLVNNAVSLQVYLSCTNSSCMVLHIT